MRVWRSILAAMLLSLATAQSGRTAPDCAPGGVACPTTFYVSADGDDANPGTSPATPWRTLARVNAQALQPGNRVLLAGGQRFAAPLLLDAGDAGTADQPVLVSTYGEGRATIMAANGDGVRLVNTHDVTLHGIDVRADDGYGGSGSGIEIVTDRPGDVKLPGLTIEDVVVAGFDRYGIHVDGNNGKSGFRDLLIDHVIAENNALGGIVVDGEFATAATGYAHAGVVIRDSRAAGSSGVPGTERPHSGSGIIVSDTDGALIERCVAHDNGWLNESRQGGPVGVWAWDANGVVIQHNEAYNNRSRSRDGGGFDLDGGATYSVLQYNYSHDNWGAGLAVMSFNDSRPTFGNVIRYNISANDSRSPLEHGAILLYGDVADTQIYQNTVYLDAEGLTGERQAALQIEPVGKDPKGRPQPRATRVLNNLFETADDLPVLRLTADPREVTFRGNAYSGGEREPVFLWRDATYAGLDAWRRATGQERLDGADVGISADPQLARPRHPPIVDDPDRLASMTSYRLASSSPLIDAGIGLDGVVVGPDVSRDFFGRPTPRGRAPDIGAHEMGGRP